MKLDKVMFVMQILSIEHLACAECLALQRRLEQAHTAAAASGAAHSSFATWLREHGASQVPAACVPLVVTFCRFMRWYHQRLVDLHMRANAQCLCVELGIVKCEHTGELLHIAAVAEGVGADGCLAFASLSHAQSSNRAGAGTVLAVRITERFGRLAQLARGLIGLCAQQVRSVCCSKLLSASAASSVKASSAIFQMHA